MRASASVHIDLSKDEVFAFWMETEAFVRVMHRAYVVHFHGPQRSGVGTDWMQWAEDPLDPIVGRHRIIHVDNGCALGMTSDDQHSSEEFLFEFFDAPAGGTEVRFSVTVVSRGSLATLLAAGFPHSIRGMMHNDLHRVKQHLEAGRGER